jgi:hypothetical protein
MAWLEEHVGTISYPGDRATTFAATIRNLQRLQLPIEQKNERDGTIVVRCLSRAMDMVFWRCWSDKLLIRLTQDADQRTRIRLVAIPNLFRTSVREHEREVKPYQLLEELRRTD